MDQQKCEGGGQKVFDINCEKILIGMEKSTVLPNSLVQKAENLAKQDTASKIACQTPEKANEFLKRKYEKGEIEIQEKCRNILEFFDGLNCSLRLLNLQKILPTFQNICCQVKVLTKRKFSYNHLAQILRIIPEAILIDKVLVHDKKTLCMKPDMMISLKLDVIQGHCEQSPCMALHKLFASRLMNFITVHPECEIPEATLPEPFNQRNLMFHSEELPYDSMVDCQPTSKEIELSFEESPLYLSFSRHFSQKAAVTKTETTEFVASPVDLLPNEIISLRKEDVIAGSQKQFAGLGYNVTNQAITCGKQNACAKVTVINTYANQFSAGFSSSESPIVKPFSSADKLIIETPVQLTPRRLMPDFDSKLQYMSCHPLRSCYKPAKRVLDFSGIEGDKSALNFSEDQSRCSDFVHNDGRKCTCTDGIIGGPVIELQKVEESLNIPDKHFKMSITGGLISQDVASDLPDLVAIIHRIFKSLSCTSITKEELVHKIIMNSLDIIDRREVEERIEHLEEQVPNWISKKFTPSGDITYNIKEASNIGLLCARTSA